MSTKGSTIDGDKAEKAAPVSEVLPAALAADGLVDRSFAFVDQTLPVNTDPKAMRRLLWKIDLMLMPIMMGCEFLQFLDKSAISYAALVSAALLRTHYLLAKQQY